MADTIFYLMMLADFVLIVAAIYQLGRHIALSDVRRLLANDLKKASEALDAAKQAIAIAEARKSDPFPEPDEDGDEDEDVCLRVGMQVVCSLSETSHTHGTIVGFALGQDGMLAIVDVGARQPMPIDVDQVEPRESKAHGYRDNADPNKQWN
jgi:hypothetical protein